MSNTEELISKLGLPARGLEIMNPEASRAFETLKQMGTEAVEPLIAAMDSANDEGLGMIISLLSLILDERAIAPIAAYLSSPNTQIRFEAITALGKYPNSDFVTPSMQKEIERIATSDPHKDVRSRAEMLLNKMGISVPQPTWYDFAHGWLELAQAFNASEARKPAPDYAKFAELIDAFSGPEKHGAWIRLAEEDRAQKYAKKRCYIEALYNNCDPNSVAWQWLDVKETQQKTRENLEKLRNQLGPILEEGGNEPKVFFVEADSIEKAREQAQKELGKARATAEETVLNRMAEDTTIEDSATTEAEVFSALGKQLPEGATIIDKKVTQPSSQRAVTIEAFDPLEAKSKAAHLAKGGETLSGVRTLLAGSKGILGLGKKQGQYEATFVTPTKACLTYHRNVRIRYTVYRTSLLRTGS